MKSLVQKLLLMSLAVAVALPLAAQDKDKDKKKNKGGGEPAAVAAIKKNLEGVDLKDEQQKKIDELIAQYKPKLADAAKAAGDAPRKMKEARKKLQDEGKKGKELNAAVKDEAKLTDEEQKAYDKLESLGQELRTAVAAVLTDEQKEKAGFNKGKKKKKDA